MPGGLSISARVTNRQMFHKRAGRRSPFSCLSKRKGERERHLMDTTCAFFELVSFHFLFARARDGGDAPLSLACPRERGKEKDTREGKNSESSPLWRAFSFCPLSLCTCKEKMDTQQVGNTIRPHPPQAVPLSALPQMPFACRHENLPAKRRGCGNCGPPYSAPGSGEPQFPVRGEAFWGQNQKPKGEIPSGF